MRVDGRVVFMSVLNDAIHELFETTGLLQSGEPLAGRPGNRWDGFVGVEKVDPVSELSRNQIRIRGGEPCLALDHQLGGDVAAVANRQDRTARPKILEDLSAIDSDVFGVVPQKVEENIGARLRIQRSRPWNHRMDLDEILYFGGGR